MQQTRTHKAMTRRIEAKKVTFSSKAIGVSPEQGFHLYFLESCKRPKAVQINISVALYISIYFGVDQGPYVNLYFLESCKRPKAVQINISVALYISIYFGADQGPYVNSW